MPVNILDKKVILFTGGGGAGTEALQKLLSPKYEIHFADADPHAKPKSIRNTFWHMIPKANEKNYLSSLQQLCKEISVDLLVPAVDEELLLLSRCRENFNCKVLLPSTEFVALHLDKLKSISALQKAGISIPKTEKYSKNPTILPPFIVKPRTGRGSRHVAKINSLAELQAHILLSHRPASDFIIQTYSQGQEYTVFMLANSIGKLLAVVPVKVILKRGITLRGSTSYDSDVISACIKIHETNPTTGCYNIQLIKTNANTISPFEINPRISTTSCLALAAGIDFIELYLTPPHNISNINNLLSFKSGLNLKRFWHNEIF